MKPLLPLLVLLATSALPAAAQTAQPVRIGDFYYYRSQDPMSDEDNSYVEVAAAESTAFQPVGMGWICVQGKLQAGFTLSRYLGDEGATVQFRFDQDPPSEPEPWVPGVNPQFTFVPPQRLFSFTRGAMAANRLVLRAWDSRGNVYTYTFSMQGVTRALQRLRCAEDLFDR